MPDHLPPDPADHADDFARRYAQEFDYLTGKRMVELGIPTGQIGSRTTGQGHACFMPQKRTGAGNTSAGGLRLDFTPQRLWSTGLLPARPRTTAIPRVFLRR